MRSFQNNPKEHILPVSSSAEQQVSLQSSFYPSLLPSLVTLVVEKVTGDMSSKIFREAEFGAVCRLQLLHQSTCHLSHQSLRETGPSMVGAPSWPDMFYVVSKSRLSATILSFRHIVL